MKRLRLVLWILVALVLIAAGALLLFRERLSQPLPDQEQASAIKLSGPFTLVGTDALPFDSRSLAGRPYAIFFGFTHCPDVCPTTLARLVRLRQQLAGKQPFAILFVTVDPERDGPTEMRNYVDLFGSPVIGLTGSPQQIAQVNKKFGIFSEKHPGENGAYTVDHTATVLLFDRHGDFQSTIAPDEADSAALDKLKRLTTNS
ncbi:MAG: SCO family protein [Sphingomicrobium sp.]